MKILANDGKEFETVEEALAYEKAKEEKKGERVQRLKDLVKALNNAIDALKEDGWKIEGEWKDDRLTLICTYGETSHEGYEDLLKAFPHSRYLKDLLGGLL